MTSDLDLTQPGPAGLYFRTERLTSSGWQQEMAARARLEPHCTICGCIPAPYGFGRHRACDALECRSDAEARMDDDRLGEGAPHGQDRAAEPDSPTHSSPDLFTRPEAA